MAPGVDSILDFSLRHCLVKRMIDILRISSCWFVPKHGIPKGCPVWNLEESSTNLLLTQAIMFVRCRGKGKG